MLDAAVATQGRRIVPVGVTVDEYCVRVLWQHYLLERTLFVLLTRPCTASARPLWSLAVAWSVESTSVEGPTGAGWTIVHGDPVSNDVPPALGISYREDARVYPASLHADVHVVVPKK
eukprot:CAMPEP_0181255670 /NCGR_PEP_ID=MMETSP1096-20121128/49286_1 /TAXON_ID=156174 ORGANISM="Chrysochromulina ericina, Strain CCMP281" /NCGR_SAMPLE_ID=MMETSP1096 /ASSEMBLY_ACC=CAM_ASM_000453 /LENGTH=117 /DNA_ID=CAMNT_0023353839 /DNA_START=359 /DNA_END=712 /DNA_ORIENTATION=+